MRIDLALAGEITGDAVRGGADQAEVFAVNSRGLTVEVRDGATESVETAVECAYAVRVFRGRRQGLAFSTDPGDHRRCVAAALEAARWTEDDPYAGLPAETGTPGQVAVFDPDIDALDDNAVLGMALAVERAAFDADRRVTRTRKTSVGLSSAESILVNSLGFAGSLRSTSISAGITVIAEDAGGGQTGWGSEGARFLADIDFPSVGREAAARAVLLLGARRVGPARAFVLLENSIATDFLEVFASALSAEAVQKGKSLLRGRTGSAVIAGILDVKDHALMDRRLGSRPYDAEGVAGRNKTLVRAGVLTGFLHNTYTARKDGTVSTGNAVRGIGSFPSVGVTNLFFSPAEGVQARSPDALTGGIDRGLLVTDVMGMHTANPISGDFSVGASGVWYENGRAVHPVREATISGNILMFLQHVVGVGDDLRFYGRTGSPSLLIEDVDISG